MGQLPKRSIKSLLTNNVRISEIVTCKNLPVTSAKFSDAISEALSQTSYLDPQGWKGQIQPLRQFSTMFGARLSAWRLAVCPQQVSLIQRQLLETCPHETEALKLLRSSMFMLFEELEECRAFARVDTPAFFDDEARDAETKVIHVGYLSSVRNPSARTVQRVVSCRRRVRNAARPKEALQLLMKTEVEPACFFGIVRTKERQ